MGTAATQPSATRHTPSTTEAAAFAMYVPCAPSVTPAIPSPVPLPPAGMLIRVSSSPSRTAVSNTPTKNSSAGIVRSPPMPRIVIDAPSATRSGGKWLVGSFTQMLPPSVPRFRTWTSATVAATSARIGRVTSTSEERISEVSVAMAPISSVDPETEIVRSSSSPARSTSTSGEAARCFITLTSVWPPASARAPSCSERRETASSTVAGRA